MKLYHGSPKKLNLIKPFRIRFTKSSKELLKQLLGSRVAEKVIRFESQKAIFLSPSFKHAALYAISKSLKGKTIFAVTPSKLVIVGNFKPSKGYVYEVKSDKSIKRLVVGKKYKEFASKKALKPLKVYNINPRDYKKDIICVKDNNRLSYVLKRN